MALDFPSSPSLNAEYTYNTKTWVWNGSAWSLKKTGSSAILDLILGVDGAGSGLDADLLDGQHGSYYLDWGNITSKPDPVITLAGDLTGSVTLTDLSSGTLTATIAANSVELGTDTAGNYVASISNGSYITGGNGGSEGAAITLAVDATSLNTGGKVVARDASGNFSAGTITATLVGNASSATTLTTGRTISTTGDVSWTSGLFDGSANVTGTATLASSGVTAGTYNSSATAVTPFTVDAKGRVTSTGANVTITPDWSSITSKPTTLSGFGISDAYTKNEVDSFLQGLDPKASVRVATTTNITLSGTQTIDGVSVIAGDRVLVKDQSTSSQNGIYIVDAGAWTRAVDMNTWAEVPGAFVFVEEGGVNADYGFVCTSNLGGTIETASVTWVQFNGATNITVGSGLSKNGNTLSLATAYGDTVNPYGSKSANQFLAAPNGSAGAPSFRSIVAADIPTLNQNTTGTAANVTGTVAIANGGTGATTAATAATNLGLGTGNSPSFTGLTLSGGTANGVVYLNASKVLTTGTALTFDGSTLGIGANTVIHSGNYAGYLKWSRKIAAYTAINGDWLICDTASGPFTITLPASPTTGMNIKLADGGDWATTNLTVGRNGSTIEGAAEDLVINIKGITVDIIYDGTTWEVYASAGPAELPSQTGNSGKYLLTDGTNVSWSTVTAGATLSNDTTTNANTFYPAMSYNTTSGTWTTAYVSNTKFYYNPSTGTVNATSFNSLSDKTLKENIKPLTIGVDGIDPVEFTWKDSGGKSFGVIAQQVEQVFPHMVETNEAGIKSVSYTQMIPLLINTVKELQHEIAALKQLMQR